ncbi:MAG: hypothetical protein JKY50_03785 [Oleispira sp.]|nr:hypothetical protein [Oleispira sp.]
MSEKKHKATVNTNYLVSRHLKLEGDGDVPWGCIEKEIDKIIGIDKVILVKEKHTISVSYDASYKSLEDIERILDKHFIRIAKDWWNETKKSWYEYTDDNIKANIKDVPWSCHSNIQTDKNKK